MNQAKYDHIIKPAAAMYLPDRFDWRFLKAQIWQESRFDPEAVSPAGAVGLTQFMPKTWTEEAPRAGYPGARRTDPEASIFTGASYMARLIENWYVRRPAVDRYCLALASYNAGLGNILKAQKAAGNPSLYCDIIAGLPSVTGDKSAETIQYVQKILEHFARLVVGLPMK